MRQLKASLFFLVVISAEVSADSGLVRDWIERMNLAMDSLSYRGTLVYMHGDSLDTLKVTHRHGPRGYSERLSTLTGVKREVVRENGEVRCLYPEDHSLMIESQLAQGVFPSFSSNRWIVSRSYYDYRLAGADRVAGLDTQVIEINPLDQHRFGYRLWLERESGLLLRSVLRNSQGKAMEQIAFTEIEIAAKITDEELHPANYVDKYVSFPTPTAGRAENKQETPEWQPSSLPPGFELSVHDHVAAADGRTSLVHLVYSDGLASISIYVEQVSDDSTGVPEQDQRGAISVYSRRDGEMLITVIGEVPYDTVALIGQSVRHNRGGQIAASE